MNDIRAEFADFTDALLLNIDFSRAQLHSVDFSGAKLIDVNLTGTTIGTVPNRPNLPCELTQEQLDRCWSDPHAPPTIAALTVDRETSKPLVWSGRSSPGPGPGET